MNNPRYNTRDILPPTGIEITAKSWWSMAASVAPPASGGTHENAQ
ncbi:hypothetical protein [Brucella sp. 458]|nr:hypothetical protein [Brucella sp. 458]